MISRRVAANRLSMARCEILGFSESVATTKSAPQYGSKAPYEQE